MSDQDWMSQVLHIIGDPTCASRRVSLLSADVPAVVLATHLGRVRKALMSHLRMVLGAGNRAHTRSVRVEAEDPELSEQLTHGARLRATTRVKPPSTLSDTRLALATELFAAEVNLLQVHAEGRPAAKARRDAAVAATLAYYRATAVDDDSDEA